MKDIAKAIAALFVVGLLLVAARNALADEWFPTGAAVYLDVTNDARGVYCYRDNGMASHLGARVPVWRHEQHTFRGMWVHNSCVEEEDDRRSRDVFGIGYEYQLW